MKGCNNMNLSETVFSLFRNNTLDTKLELISKDSKDEIIVKVKNNPYHDDELVVMSVENDSLVMNKAHHSSFVDMLNKYVADKDIAVFYEKTLSTFVENNSTFEKIMTSELRHLQSLIEPSLTQEIISQTKVVFSLFDYKDTKFEYVSVDKCIDKCVDLIIKKYTENWVQNEVLVVSDKWFDKLYKCKKTNIKKQFDIILSKTLEYGYACQVTDKIFLLVDKSYTGSSKTVVNMNSDSVNTISIIIDNNLWRNGLIKGNKFFGKIKTSGKNPYIIFKDIFAYQFSNINIAFSANKTEQKAELIRISLPVFMEHLDNPSDDFIKLLNSIFLRNISFPEFGCCSKYTECEESGKCLHADQLYATACQYQKLMKRTGKFE